jgi:hypothetical protein
MSSRRRSPLLDLAAEAVLLAEEGLVDLPSSSRAEELREQVASLKGTLRDMSHDGLRERHQEVENDAVRLAAEVWDYRRRAAG